jgi:hypothetical protein
MTWRQSLRLASFLSLVAINIVIARTNLSAHAACNTTTISACSQGAPRFGRNCAWDGQNPPPSCADFMGDVCNAYCWSANPSQNGVDPGSTYCAAGEISYCWCNGWSPCPVQGCDPTGVNQMNCVADNAQWDPYTCSCNYSPILIGLIPGGSYRLSSVEQGVWFDVTGDGTLERTAWTLRQSPVGFLVMDRNGNGTIDSATEMFGSLTPLTSGARAANGFDVLAEIDANGSHPDGVINALDPDYHRMHVWTDWNHDGVSSTSELIPLDRSGIVGIDVAYRAIDYTDRHGNRFAFAGTARFRWFGIVLKRKIYDVFLRLDP